MNCLNSWKDPKLEASSKQVFNKCSFNCDEQDVTVISYCGTKLFQVLNKKKGMEPKVATRAGYLVKEITVLEAHLSQHIIKDQSHPLFILPLLFLQHLFYAFF